MLSIASSRLSSLVLFVLIALSGWAIYLTEPPTAQPASAPPTEFSAERAMTHIRQIAREPHAIGTPDHPRVRGYLLNALRGLGLQPQIQEAIVVRPSDGVASLARSGAMLGRVSKAAYVYNVLTRIPGQQPGKAVLLMAHYDSQPSTPGAADDGAGVAAILETARALRQAGTLRHDVILLLTDGEEYGLFGARAFLKHPWAREVALVMNVESRGNSGPSMTFELSPQNGWIVKQLAEAAPHPVATSLMYEVYRRLPNNTDFTPFREAGFAGLNSAITDGFVHYHKLTDSPQNLNLNSVQHHGDNLLALTRHFANGSLDAVKAPDRVFFNGAGHWLIQYPMWLNSVWMVLLTVAFGVVFWLGNRQHALTGWQVLGGLGLWLLILVVLGSLCWGVNLAITGALPLHHFFNGSYSATTFAGAFSLLSVGTFGLLVRLVLRWLRPFSLVLGGYGLIYILTSVSYFLLPAAIYMFLFPLLFGLAGLGMVLWQNRLHPEEGRPAYALLFLLAALPTLFVLLPMVWLLFVIFDIQLPMVPVLLLGLALVLLLPLWLLVEQGLRWHNRPVLPLGALGVGIVLGLIAIQTEGPSAERPLHTQISYFLNADTRQAVWASYYLTMPDDWNRQFFPKPTYGPLTEIYPNAHLTDFNNYLKNPAKAITDAPPVATVLSDVTPDSIRQLTLDLHSVRGAAHLEMVLFPGQANSLRSVHVNGDRVPLEVEQTPDGPAYDLLFHGLPTSKRITLSLDLTAGSSLQLLLYDQSIGLPVELIKTPRPAWVVPEQGSRNYLTVIRKTYKF